MANELDFSLSIYSVSAISELDSERHETES